MRSIQWIIYFIKITSCSHCFVNVTFFEQSRMVQTQQDSLLERERGKTPHSVIATLVGFEHIQFC